MYSVETGKAEQVLDAQNGKYTLSIAYVGKQIVYLGENYYKVYFLHF